MTPTPGVGAATPALCTAMTATGSTLDLTPTTNTERTTNMTTAIISTTPDPAVDPRGYALKRAEAWAKVAEMRTDEGYTSEQVRAAATIAAAWAHIAAAYTAGADR